MRHHTGTALILVFLICGLYVFFFVFLMGAIEKLNVAREEELKAITLHQKLLKRIKKRKSTLPENSASISEACFNLPLPDSKEPKKDDLWPEVSTQETNIRITSITTAHFVICSYNQELLKFLAARIEKYYDNIVQDIGFYEASVPQKEIKIYIFGSKEEYIRQTGRPLWSQGFASLSDWGVYTYENENLRLVLPHELTHLMFEMFLEGKQATDDILWIKEGLALFEEMREDENYRKNVLGLMQRTVMENKYVPTDEISKIKLTENSSNESVNLWYAQSGAMICFLIEQRTRNRFYNFCNALKNFKEFDKSLSYAYAGEFMTAADLDAPFKEYIRSLDNK